MASKTASVNINIVANAAKAAAGFKDAADAGAEFAKALNKAADKAEKELESIGKMADLLAKKLGPQFRTVAGEGIEDIARKMTKAGLTFEQLEGDVDGITAAFRRLEAQADDVDTRIRQVGDTTDKSRSVMANFTGNAVQELPGMTGAFGPLNMAIGQFAEYAAEGEIKMSGLIKAFGPMLALGAGVAVVSQIVKGLSENADFSRENVAMLTDALKESGSDGTDAIDSLVEEWTRLGKIEAVVTKNVERSGFSWEKFFNPFSDKKSFDTVVTGVEDITDELANLGLTARQFAQLSLGTNEQLDLFKQEMLASGVAASDLDFILSAVASTQADAAKAAENAAFFQRVFGSELQTSTTYADRFNDEMKRQKDLVDLLDDGWSRYWDAFNNELARREVWESFQDTDIALEDRLRMLGEYVQTVLKFPADAMKRLNWNVAEGDLAAAERYLATLERIRIALSAPDYWYPWFNGARPSSTTPGAPRGYAAGTNSAQEGLRLVGERGPELIDFGGGERVYNAGRTNSMLGGTTSIVVNMPTGSNGDDVVRALRQWTLNNGALPIPVTSSVVR